MQRVEMLNHWAVTAHRPLLFWPAAFTFPTAFLTAVLQQAARKNGTSVDLLTWEFAVIEEDPAAITQAPEVRANVLTYTSHSQSNKKIKN